MFDKLYDTEYNRQEAIDFLYDHCVFDNSDMVYVILGVSRNKLNKETKKEKRITKVIRKESDIEKLYDSIVSQLIGTSFYIYVSVNARDVKKAAINLNKKIIDVVAGDDMTYLKSLDAKWISELMKESAKFNRGNYMIDLDKDESLSENESLYSWDNPYEMDDNLFKIGIDVIKERKTPNGYHIVCKPFDVRLIEIYRDASIKKDEVIFVNSFIKNPILGGL
jgi:hypothetical protein